MIFVRSILVIVAFLACANAEENSASRERSDTDKLIEKVFDGTSGFVKPKEKGDKRLTYGETTFEAVKGIIEETGMSEDDVFYDLGCGTGKVVVQVYIDAKVKKSIGIEICKDRADQAKLVMNKLNKEGIIEKDRILDFWKKDFLKVDMRDATVIYMCSTCFPDTLMDSLVKKFKKLKPGVKIVTLKPLPEDPSFKLTNTKELPMTWAESTSVYFYELVRISG